MNTNYEYLPPQLSFCQRQCSDDEEKYEMESEIDEPVSESGSQYETETDASQTTGTEDSVDLDRLVKLVLLWLFYIMIFIVHMPFKVLITNPSCKMSDGLMFMFDVLRHMTLRLNLWLISKRKIIYYSFSFNRQANLTSLHILVQVACQQRTCRH